MTLGVCIDYIVDALTYIDIYIYIYIPERGWEGRGEEKEIPLGAWCVYRLRSISPVDRERTVCRIVRTAKRLAFIRV